MNQGYGGGSRAGIRHAYPLSVTSASFTTAFILNLRTLPYAFIRFFLHAIHALIAIAFFGALIVCAIVVGKNVHPWVGIAVFFGGVVIYAILWSWWFRYVLYAVKCGHIACLTDLVTRGKVESGGEGMLSYGRHVVRDRFPDIVQVYLLQGLIRGVVGEFNMALGLIGDLLPFDLGFVMIFGRRLLRASTRYLDETLFSYSLIRRNEPLWDVCSEGLGYYFQNSKEILKTTIWMMFLSTMLRWVMWIAFMILGVIVLLPVANAIVATHAHQIATAFADDGSGTPSDPSGIIAILGAFTAALFFSSICVYSVTHAFLHPVYLTMVMTKFLIVIQSQRLDPSFERFLGSSRANALRNFTTQLRGNGARSR
jgi:hypothetical protein